MKGMNETEPINQPASQCNGGRDEPAGGKNQTDEEYILGHLSSVREKCVAVQAEVIMANLRFLWAPASYERSPGDTGDLSSAHAVGI